MRYTTAMFAGKRSGNVCACCPHAEMMRTLRRSSETCRGRALWVARNRIRGTAETISNAELRWRLMRRRPSSRRYPVAGLVACSHRCAPARNASVSRQSPAAHGRRSGTVELRKPVWVASRRPARPPDRSPVHSSDSRCSWPATRIGRSGSPDRRHVAIWFRTARRAGRGKPGATGPNRQACIDCTSATIQVQSASTARLPWRHRNPAPPARQPLCFWPNASQRPDTLRMSFFCFAKKPLPTTTQSPHFTVGCHRRQENDRCSCGGVTV